NLESEENMFDTAIAIGSLHHLKDPIRGIMKMEQMTRGSIVIADWNSKSAGIHNPHSREDLEQKEKSIKLHAAENGYSVSDFDYWYMIHKTK
ncbi:SAM-dependent methyltransferase, partial [mine drainage metagenome]